MDVVDTNFYDAYALLERLLPDAKFVAIDLEFTGLGRARPSHLDTPGRRYATARDDAEAYPPLQFGLVLFRHTPDPAPTVASGPVPTQNPVRWQAIPFNFNLYPRAVYYPEKARFPFLDRSLVLQASTVHFLLGHGFDFMRCFESGISWLRADDATAFRTHVAEHRRVRRAPPRRADPRSPDDEAAVAKVRSIVGEWLSLNPNPDPERRLIKLFDLPRGSVPRRLVFDMMRDAFPSTVASSMGTHAGVKLRVEALPSAEEATARRDGDEAAIVDDVVERAIGFRAVVDLLRDSGTTIVVHHGLMDVTKLFANFVGPLPQTVPEFKHAFKNAFPSIVDTRWGLDYLCARDRQVATVLGRDPIVSARPPHCPRNYFSKPKPVSDHTSRTTEDFAAKTNNRSGPKQNGAAVPGGSETSVPNGDAGSGPQPMQIVEPSEAASPCVGDAAADVPDPAPSAVSSATAEPGEATRTTSAQAPTPAGPPAHAAHTSAADEKGGDATEKHDPRKAEILRRRANGRGPPAGPAFWGGGGGGGIKELGNIKEALLEHSRLVGLGERVAVDTFVPTDLPDESGALNGFVIPEGSTRWDRNSDRFSFGRYCVDGMRNGFQHEAGFDALETGKLLILLRELGAVAHVTDQMKNKIFLGTCGGFKAIDLDGGEEEHNEWFAREAIVVSGDLPPEAHEHRFRAALRRITDGTAFDAELSEYFTVDKNSFVGVLARRDDVVDDDSASGGKRRLEDSMEEDSGLGVVLRNAQNSGLTATRYDRELLASRWRCDEDEEVKRRRIG